MNCVVYNKRVVHAALHEVPSFPKDRFQIGKTIFEWKAGLSKTPVLLDEVRLSLFSVQLDVRLFCFIVEFDDAVNCPVQYVGGKALLFAISELSDSASRLIFLKQGFSVTYSDLQEVRDFLPVDEVDILNHLNDPGVRPVFYVKRSEANWPTFGGLPMQFVHQVVVEDDIEDGVSKIGGGFCLYLFASNPDETIGIRYKLTKQMFRK